MAISKTWHEVDERSGPPRAHRDDGMARHSSCCAADLQAPARRLGAGPPGPAAAGSQAARAARAAEVLRIT
jgi:hypothetical protein